MKVRFIRTRWNISEATSDRKKDVKRGKIKTGIDGVSKTEFLLQCPAVEIPYLDFSFFYFLQRYTSAIRVSSPSSSTDTCSINLWGFMGSRIPQLDQAYEKLLHFLTVQRTNGDLPSPITMEKSIRSITVY